MASNEAVLTKSREQLQRALALIESGPASPDQVARVRQLSAELDEQQKHAQLLAALDQAWTAQMRTDITRSAASGADCIPLLRASLEAYGIAVGRGSPEEAAIEIARKPERVRENLLAAIDEWHALAPPLIGITTRTTELDTVITGVIRESVAHHDGRLKQGDQLIGVGPGQNGPIVDVRAMKGSEISKLLAGDAGTFVRLQIVPQGEAKPQTYELQRDTTRPWLRAVVQAADSDPWRERVR